MNADKPVVTYTRRQHDPVVGQSAWLEGLEGHPKDLNGALVCEFVRTSTVLFFNPENGVIETRNTIYVPKDQA